MSTRRWQRYRTGGVGLALVVAMGLVGCTHTVTLHSLPEGATVYLDGEEVGATPYAHQDAGPGPQAHQVKLIMRGYETYRGEFERGFMGSYPEDLTFELTPGS